MAGLVKENVEVLVLVLIAVDQRVENDDLWDGVVGSSGSTLAFR